jgi:hypothetical protein
VTVVVTMGDSDSGGTIEMGNNSGGAIVGAMVARLQWQ